MKKFSRLIKVILLATAASGLLSACVGYGVPYNEGAAYGRTTTIYGNSPIYDQPNYGGYYGAPVYGGGVTIYGTSDNYPYPGYGRPVYGAPGYRPDGDHNRHNDDRGRDNKPHRADRDRNDGNPRVDNRPNRGPSNANTAQGRPERADRPERVRAEPPRRNEAVPDRGGPGRNNLGMRRDNEPPPNQPGNQPGNN
jgi:hypothetical protein